jgi:drug/metabolite transporter (DMT)-like permease
MALMCFGALDTTSKLAAAVVPVMLALWVRYAVQTAFTLAALWPKRGNSLFHSGRPGLQLLRTVLLVVCNGIAYVSLAHMQVGEFTAIVMLTPLLLTVVAAWALKEPVSLARWLCVLGGFLGTLIVIRPGREMFQWTLLLPLVLVGANAAFQVVTSALTKVDEPGTIHLYSGLGGLILMTAALPYAWVNLPLEMWLIVGLMGVLGASGHFLLIVAYARAPVAVLTPYLYLQIAFGALGAWVVFSHIPDAWSLVGISLIAAFGVLGTYLTGREALASSRREAMQSSIDAIGAADAH